MCCCTIAHSRQRHSIRSCWIYSRSQNQRTCHYRLISADLATQQCACRERTAVAHLDPSCQDHFLVLDSLVSVRLRISKHRYCQRERRDEEAGTLIANPGSVQRTALLLNFAKNDILLYYCVASIKHLSRSERRLRRGCPGLFECGSVEMSWRCRGWPRYCWRSEMCVMNS